MTIRLREPERSRVMAELKAGYEAGAKIRDLAERIGFSYSATRAMLLSAGVVLRPKRCASVDPVPVGSRPLIVACPVCDALPMRRCMDRSFRLRQPHVKRARLAAVAEAGEQR
jgi:hypothetical protein